VPLLPWIATGVLAVGTGVSGWLTYRQNQAYGSLRNAYPVTRDQLDASHGKTENFITATSILGGATLVSLAVATYFTFGGSRRERTMALGVSPTGVSFQARLP
jgi:hypothetical protein